VPLSSLPIHCAWGTWGPCSLERGANYPSVPRACQFASLRAMSFHFNKTQIPRVRLSPRIQCVMFSSRSRVLRYRKVEGAA